MESSRDLSCEKIFDRAEERSSRVWPEWRTAHLEHIKVVHVWHKSLNCLLCVEQLEMGPWKFSGMFGFIGINSGLFLSMWSLQLLHRILLSWMNFPSVE